MVLLLPDALPMRPRYRELVWGGRRLAEVYEKPLPPDRPIGESFEVSALPEWDSLVASGSLEGRTLTSLVGEFGHELLGRPVWERYGGVFPLLIKLIDAQDDLSIQVHPDDDHVQRNQLGRFGKMEAWYVLHSDGGRVALGLKEGVGPSELRRAIEQGEVEEVVSFHPVCPGDVVCLPPGTVHALCRGVMVYEVQQSSDLTFRLYDYERLGLDGQPRELHVESALEVIDFEAGPRRPLLSTAGEDGNVPLVEASHFRLSLHSSGGSVTHATGEAFAAITMVRGQARLTGSGGGSECVLAAGDTALIPAGREITLSGEGSGAGLEYLLASPAGD